MAGAKEPLDATEPLVYTPTAHGGQLGATTGGQVTILP